MEEIYGLLELANIDDNPQRWLQIRKSGIGSSDIAVIAGLSQYTSPLELWLEKTGKVPGVEDNDAMALGRHLEPFIGRLYAQRSGSVIIPAKCIYRHPEISFALASPDFWISDRDSLGILECKNTSSRRAHEWESAIPLWAQIQLQWQMGVIGPRFGAVAGLIGSNTHEFKHERFEFSPDVFDQCLELASQFWDFVTSDTPPDPGPGDSRAIEALIGERLEGTIELNSEIEALVNEYLDLSAERKSIEESVSEIEKAEKAIRNKLLLAMGNHRTATLPSGKHFLRAITVRIPEKLTRAYEFTRFDVRAKK